MAVKAVIFDIDDTMYDYTAGDKAAKSAAREYCRCHLAVEADKFDEWYECADRLMVGRIGYSCGSVHNRLIRFQCMMELLKKPLFPHVKALYQLYWGTLLKGVEPQPGLKELMKRLKEQKIQIGVGTNMTAFMQYEKLEYLGVGEMVDWMVTSEECGVEKPNPKFFELCVSKSGFSAKECLFIGDSLKGDAEGALECGLNAVWYTALGQQEDACPDGIVKLASFEAWR